MVLGHLTHSLKPKGEPFQARAIDLCLIGHHPVHSDRGYCNGPGLNVSFTLAYPRFPGVALWLCLCLLTDELFSKYPKPRTLDPRPSLNDSDSCRTLPPTRKRRRLDSDIMTAVKHVQSPTLFLLFSPRSDYRESVVNTTPVASTWYRLPVLTTWGIPGAYAVSINQNIES